MGLFSTVGGMLVSGVKHAHFRQIIHSQREVACSALSDYVQQCTAQQFDELERDFLEHSSMLVDAAKRLRAMELYAYLKILEVARFGSFRGFMGASYALG
jgi:hypothetical protein